MAIGRTNAIAGKGKLATALETRRIDAGDGEVTITLTCDFDPLVVCAYFKDRGSGDTYEDAVYRISADDATFKNLYTDSEYTGIGVKLSINGRTITYGTFSSSGTAYANAYIRAFGLSEYATA